MLRLLFRALSQAEGVLAAMLGMTVALYIDLFARFFCRYRQIKDGRKQGGFLRFFPKSSCQSGGNVVQVLNVPPITIRKKPP